MISKSQIVIIHVAKSKLGLEDWIYRAILMKHAGVKSSSDPRMDYVGFKNVMAEFKTLGFKSTGRQKLKKHGKVAGGASVAQVEYVQDMWTKITNHRRGYNDFNNTLFVWLHKHFTVLHEYKTLKGMLNGLDGRTVHIIIGILKAMMDKKSG